MKKQWLRHRSGSHEFDTAQSVRGGFENWRRRISLAFVLAGTVFGRGAIAQTEAVTIPIIPITSPSDARTHGLESLRTVVTREGVPLPPNLNSIIKNYTAARQLGKALFHDMAAGSDGIQACASCHFNAGADPRNANMLSPGLLRAAHQRQGDIIGFSRAPAAPDVSFESYKGPNSVLERTDFPFVRDIGNGNNVIANPDGSLGPAIGNRNDTGSSQGVFVTRFDGVIAGGGADGTDYGTPQNDAVFKVNGITTRRVPPRNTPTVINAVFNFTNFWDGRAANSFNGENPFGEADRGARVFTGNALKPAEVKLNLSNASLASQASGPALSDFEMSYGAADSFRNFAQLGRKLLTRTALKSQAVAADDSLLAPIRSRTGIGLTKTYEDLITQAFADKYTGTAKFIEAKGPKRSIRSTDQASTNMGTVRFVNGRTMTDPANTYTLNEANFALFWSISIMLYEATLVSDLTPFDNWMRGVPDTGFGARELRGLNVFADKGKCINCHGGPELTNASVRKARSSAENLIEPMLMGNRQPALYDNGFYNIGVTPTTEDIARGNRDPWGQPLAFSRQFAVKALGLEAINFKIEGSPIHGLVCDPADVADADLNPATSCEGKVIGFRDVDGGGFVPICSDANGDRQCSPNETLLLRRVANDGSFKTPGLRNVAQTAPYFHNGSHASLREVVEFYNRGGNFCRTNRDDLDADIQGLGLSEDEKGDLVAFLLSLSDQRVLNRAAPFDAPELRVPTRHPGDDTQITAVNPAATFQAADGPLLVIPAVGKNGGAPLSQFLAGVDHYSANAVSGGVCSPDFGF